ncbi:MAG: DNA translocase FtsK [Isosphaeraceae bacterium]
MPVTLQVRDVHSAIYQAGGGPASAGDGAPSTILLGRLFHEIFTDLIGTDSRKSLKTTLDELSTESDARRRETHRHVYDTVVGPRIRRNQANLHESSSHVLTFWRAVAQLCDWLAESPEKLAAMTTAEPLTLELREPTWTDSVVVVGIPDALVKVPDSNAWCVVELKLGRTAPEADLAQTCLYHLMLSSADQNGRSTRRDTGSLALVSFEPEPRERLFAAAELENARRKLTELIGRLAGVCGNGPGPIGPIVEPPIVPEPPYKELGEKLVATLHEYGAEARLAGPPIVGPTFLRYPILPDKGVRVAAIQNRAQEIRVRLGLDQPPRIGMEGGRVVIDLQRPDRQVVHFEHLRDQLLGGDPLLGNSKIPIGVDLNGKLQFADFARPENSHLLVAGTTGSGKSEWLRTMLAGLLVSNTPETLRLVLIDPKRNAFTTLQNSPFLLRPIVYPDSEPVSKVLESLAEEMDRRYRLLAESGSDNLAEHVKRTGRSLPRIICVCDEYADVLRRERDEKRAIEHQINRLGSKARAAGIHLTLATQQPSRETIRGALDTNIPARVGLKTNSYIESKMLLATTGAENLLGHGDLLFKDIGDPVRLQGAYLSPELRDKLFATATKGLAATHS